MQGIPPIRSRRGPADDDPPNYMRTRATTTTACGSGCVPAALSRASRAVGWRARGAWAAAAGWSSGAARLFLLQVALFEAELGVPSGIGPVEDDECRIDPVLFEGFVHALLERHRGARHVVVSALSEGFRHGAGARRARRNHRAPGPARGRAGRPCGRAGLGLHEGARFTGRGHLGGPTAGAVLRAQPLHATLTRARLSTASRSPAPRRYGRPRSVEFSECLRRRRRTVEHTAGPARWPPTAPPPRRAQRRAFPRARRPGRRPHRPPPPEPPTQLTMGRTGGSPHGSSAPPTRSARNWTAPPV